MSDLVYMNDKHYIDNQRVIQRAEKVHGMMVFHTLNGCQDTRPNDSGLQHDKVYFLDSSGNVMFCVQSSATVNDGVISVQSLVRSTTDKVPRM